MPCGLWLLLVLPPLQLGVDLQGSTSPVVACEGAMPVVHDLCVAIEQQRCDRGPKRKRMSQISSKSQASASAGC